MRRLFLAGLYLFSFAACSTQTIKRNPDGARAAVIFLPGYKGTALKKPGTDEVVWVTPSEALFGNRSLALNGQEAGIENSVEVEPEGLLRSLTIFPLLYTIAIYEDWIRFIEESLPSDTVFIEHGYDWRLDNAENAAKLAATIQSLEAHGTHDISIISHSMGGLILAYYLRYGAQPPEHATETWEGATHVRRAVFAGTPFRGSIAIFRDLQRGNPQVWNRDILSRDTLGTFYSTYELMPPAADRPLLGSDGEPLLIDLFSPEEWIANRWGFLCGPMSRHIREGREAILRSRLTRAALFSELINREPRRDRASSSPPGTEYLSITGHFGPTVARAIRSNEDCCPAIAVAEDKLSEIFPGFDRGALFDEGDGIVPRKSSVVPPAYAERLHGTARLFQGVEHGDFFNVPEIRQAVLDFILQRETK